MRKRSIFGGKSRMVSGSSFVVGYQVPYMFKDVAKVKDLSREALVRLKFLEFSESHPVAVTCRRFGISRATFYWTVELVKMVQSLREKYPAWGKAKLLVLLKRDGIKTSASTVGRIFSDSSL